MEKYIYGCKLIRVVDGDTVDAMIDVGFNIWIKKRLRLLGINAYECRTKDLNEKAKGLAAKDRLIEILVKLNDEPNYFEIVSHGVGKYGRVLAEIFVKDSDGYLDVNKKLLIEGHAVPYS